VSTQLDLLGEKHPLGLTEKQAFAHEILLAARDGLDAVDLGRAWHARRGKHTDEQTCTWCEKDGRSVLVALRKRGLACQRRALQNRWIGLGEAGPGRGSMPPVAAGASPSADASALSASPSPTGLPIDYEPTCS